MELAGRQERQRDDDESEGEQTTKLILRERRGEERRGDLVGVLLVR